MYEDDLLDVIPYEPGQPGSKLPDSSAVLTLGIISLSTSIICCVLYGLPGLVTGIIGLVLGDKAMKIYKASPHSYSHKSYKDVKTGRILSIIGISISGLIILMIVIFLGIGLSLSEFPFQ